MSSTRSPPSSIASTFPTLVNLLEMDKKPLQKPKKEEERRKLPLIKINYLDLLEDDPPTSKVGKVKKPKCTVNASSLRKVPKPRSATYNSSEWKDSPSLGKLGKLGNGTKKNSPKKTVPDNEVFIKPKSLMMKLDKSVRKDLFGGRSNTLYASISNKDVFIPKVLNPPKSAQLDNTQPLIDVNEAEIKLYKKLDCFKTFNNIPLNLKTNIDEALQTVPNLTDIPFDVNVKSANVSSPMNTDSESTELITVLKLPPQNNTETTVSPTEYEFMKNEKICDIPKIESESKLKSCLSKSSNNNINDGILKFLHNELEGSKYIKNKFKILEKEFKEFQLEMAAFQEQHTQNIEKLMEVLENGKENFTVNSDLNGLQNYLSESLSIRSNKKKNVAFHLNNSVENKQIPNNVELDDKGLEKAVNFYNSMRNDYKSILSTPKLDRSVLHTPKSIKKSQMDSISRRLQKQCLLLLDTPSNKNK